jgi:hypothetical protein
MIERRYYLSQDEFCERYRCFARPVVMQGVTSAWPAAERWTPEYLKVIAGAQKIQVMANRNANRHYETSYDEHRTEMSFAAYIDWVYSTKDGNDSYIHAQNKFMQTELGRKLQADIGPLPDYLDDNQREGRIFFWFGAAGTVTPLHHDDCDVLFCQMQGRKRFRLISPQQKHLLYNGRAVFSDVDAEKPDLSQYPLYRFVASDLIDLYPGDTLFIPSGWWHHVRALDISISVSCTNFL